MESLFSFVPFSQSHVMTQNTYKRAEVPEDSVPRPPGEGGAGLCPGADPSADDLHFKNRKNGKLSKLQCLT